MNKFGDMGIDETRMQNFPSYVCISSACRKSDYLHVGRKDSNEAIIKGEYLMNGSNIFSIASSYGVISR